MKKFLIIVGILISTNYSFSQDFSRVLNTNKIDWYGLDFTKAKMIGSVGFTNPDIICDRYVKNKWNWLVFSESEKYNISKCIGGKEIKIHLDYILERNSVIACENLIINSEYEINKTDIQEMIKTYPDKDGIGMVFIVESFNKLNETASIWVTFFDNSTKEVLKTTEYSSEPGGIGVLNYWLGGVYETYKKLKKDYKKW